MEDSSIKKLLILRDPDAGIQELRPIDPLDIKYIRKKKDDDPKTQLLNKTLNGAKVENYNLKLKNIMNIP